MAVRRFCRTWALAIVVGSAIGVATVMVWLGISSRHPLAGVGASFVPDAWRVWAVAFNLMLLPIAVPVGVIAALPLTIPATFVLGTVLSTARQLPPLAGRATQVALGVGLGGGAGWWMIAGSGTLQRTFAGDIVPGALMGAAIGLAWAVIDRPMPPRSRAPRLFAAPPGSRAPL